MNASTSETKDPICGLSVDKATALQDQRDCKTFYTHLPRANHHSMLRWLLCAPLAIVKVAVISGRIGVARLNLPDHLPPGATADPPATAVNERDCCAQEAS